MSGEHHCWNLFLNKDKLKGELHSNYFFPFRLNLPRIGFHRPKYKNELCFSSKTHISISFTQDIYGIFYLLT